MSKHLAKIYAAT